MEIFSYVNELPCFVRHFSGGFLLLNFTHGSPPGAMAERLSDVHGITVKKYQRLLVCQV